MAEVEERGLAGGTRRGGDERLAITCRSASTGGFGSGCGDVIVGYTGAGRFLNAFVARDSIHFDVVEGALQSLDRDAVEGALQRLDASSVAELAELATADVLARGGESPGDVALQGVARPAEVRDRPVFVVIKEQGRREGG